MTPDEIIERIKNGERFVQSLSPPNGLTPSETANWQIIATSALTLLRMIEQWCPPDPLKVEAVTYVLRTMSVVSGAFIVRSKVWPE